MSEKSIHQINAEHRASLGLKSAVDYHEEGQAAFSAGQQFFDNPYCELGQLQLAYHAWGAGWMSAYQKANNHG